MNVAKGYRASESLLQFRLDAIVVAIYIQELRQKCQGEHNQHAHDKGSDCKSTHKDLLFQQYRRCGSYLYSNAKEGRRLHEIGVARPGQLRGGGQPIASGRHLYRGCPGDATHEVHYQ